MHDPVLVYPETPTIPELLRLRIPERIGPIYYIIFGTLLLQDDTGSLMNSIQKQYSGNIEYIIVQILRMWLQGKGVQPVTWGSLIRVVRQCQSNILAADIEQAIIGITIYIYN